MEARITEDEFLCPVCLNLLKDPVTISCGHSFCWSCIRQCWNQQDESEIYSCPQCRETFFRRPALAKNTILAKMLEKLKIKPFSDHHTGDGDVPCDACPGRKYKAVKSCVECQESYCLSHLEQHEEFHSRKRHRMIEATDGLPLEDQQCVDEPMIHDSVSAQRTETQSSPSLSALPESTDVPFTSLSLFKDVTHYIYHLVKKLEEFCCIVMKKIHDKVSDIFCSRSDFLCYSRQFTLDLNTMSNYLLLSEGNTVTTTDTVQSYPDHPDRFQYAPQVLCEESVSGRCYWELEWTGDDVEISVSYKSISRKGLSDESWFGCNNQSWSLICSSSWFSLRHNNIKTYLTVSSSSRRVGVFVDHDAGTLSFYSVSDTMTLIHRVQTTFTQPLCPGVYVDDSSSVKLCDMSE